MKRILLIFGGNSKENYLSLRSAENFLKKIDKKNFLIIPVKLEHESLFIQYDFNSLENEIKNFNSLYEVIISNRFEKVLNLLHDYKECHKITCLVEYLKIPIIGNSFFTNFIGFNKLLTKQTMNFLNIKTPKFLYLNKDTDFSIKNLTTPLIIKPCLSGSSIGIEKADSEKKAKILIKMMIKEFDELIIEEFIEGDEYCVGICGDYKKKEKIILPVGKIEYKGDFFDEGCKFRGDYNVIIPSNLSERMEKKLIEISLKLHNFLKSNFITRTDFIVKDDKIYTLEINTAPGLSCHSIITKMLQQSVWDINNLFDKIFY